ncbi:unnamed protein product, partial [Allacma fusca]
VDQIIVLKNGRISEIGAYQELLDKQGEFSEFVTQYSNSENMDPETLADNLEQLQRRRLISGTSHASENSGEIDKETLTATLSSDSSKDKDSPEAQKLIEDEFKEMTSIPWSLYYDYCKSAGWSRVIISLLAYAVYQVFAVSTNYWLSVWSEKEVINGTQVDQGYNIEVYAALGVSQTVMYVLAITLMCLAILNSATVFHSKMLKRVLKAPMSFFDTTPSGRILNRFAKDVDVLDNSLSLILRNFLRIVVNVLGTLFIIVYNLPIFAVVVVPLAILYYLVQKFYIPTSRQVKRLESVTRSPIYSNFSETINGASTVRAYGQINRFLLNYQEKVDANQMCFFPSLVSNRWLCIRLECMGSVVVFCTTIFAVMNRETNLVAVERLKEYCEAPQEASWKSIIRKPPKTWPTSGSVQFKNYQTKYREGLDLVLKDVSFEIMPGEKIGVVGRTGAGKTSLTLALFRLIEGTGGSIIIDGENISKIGLHDLRGKLTIIPQDP